jgi:uncharacterized short protein YbdD (DUF466 family)
MASVANLSATPGPAAVGSLTLLQRCEKIARRTWRGIREWCGDAAYESYLRAKHRQPGPGRVLTPEEFYVEQLERRYSRPNRCC